MAGQPGTGTENEQSEPDIFQRGFAALSTCYFDLISRGKARKWASYITDAIAQKRMGFDLPEYDPNYRFRIHEATSTKSRSPAKLSSGEKLFTHAQVPLQGAASIRLVTLHPGEPHTRINCTLKTVSLGQSSAYKALSYTWGDSVASSFITLNGSNFPVTENLHVFLRRARSDAESQAFWIDSICINQGDQNERSKQVRLMRDVYASANSVQVWLGDETGSTAAAFALARALAMIEPQLRQGIVLSPGDVERSTREILASQDINWKALDLIYWLPWFGRTWIIQEIALAKNAEVQCGSHKMPWDDLVAAGRLLVQHHLTSALDIDPGPITAMQRYRDATVSGQNLTLLELMHNSRSNWSTDPRDKIYGLLGIAAEDQAYHLDPDYERSVEDVYKEIALSFARKDNSLDFLSCVEDYKWRVHQKLPSWVPDWTAHPRSTPFLSQPYRWQFFASGESLPQIHFKSATASLLHIRGKILDTITRVGSADVPIRDNISGGRDHSYFRQTLILGAVAQRQHWENLVNDLESYPTGTETPMEAYHHTAIAEGRLDSSEGSEKEDVPRFYTAWKKHWKYLLNYRLSNLPQHATPEELEQRELATVYTQAWKEAFRFRRFIVTERGYMGLASYSARPDDRVCLLYGGKTVYILREVQKDGRREYRFICEAYIRGLMQGQGMRKDFGHEVEFGIS